MMVVAKTNIAINTGHTFNAPDTEIFLDTSCIVSKKSTIQFKSQFSTLPYISTLL